jgi:WD40-like Beta Propeller Repeat
MKMVSRIVKLFLLFLLVQQAACSTLLLKSPVPFDATAIPTLSPLTTETFSNVQPETCRSAAPGLPVGSGLESSHIVYQAGKAIETPNEVWIYSPADGSRKLLFDNLPYPYYQPGLMEDGFHVVLVDKGRFWISDLGGSPLKLMDQSTREIQLLKQSLPRDSKIWRIYNNLDDTQSPDGSKSAVWNLGDPSLIIMNNQTGEKTEVLKYDNRGYIAGSWSPDGSIYAITYSEDFQGAFSRAYVVNSDGTNLRELARYVNLDLGRPYWSPDGKKIVFALHKSLQSQPTYYQLLSLTTRTIKAFAVNAEESLAWRSGNDLIWSPDSNWFLFFTQEYTIDHWKYAIETINIGTGDLFCITNDDLIETIADWR